MFKIWISHVIFPGCVRGLIAVYNGPLSVFISFWKDIFGKDKRPLIEII